MSISTWNDISHLSADAKPSKRWGHASCTISNQLIIFGGFSENKYFNDIWVFDSSTLQWEQVITVGQIPHQRSHSSLNLHSNEKDLILFGGGSKDKQRFNTVHFLNWPTKEWKLIQIPQNQNCPEPRTYHSANIIGNYLVVFGGEGLVDLGDLWIFDLESHKWTEVKSDKNESKPEAMRFHTACQRKNELIFMGGCKNKYKMIQDIWALNFDKFILTKNPQDLIWRSVAISFNSFFNSFRWGHSACYNKMNDRIYIYGGRNSQGDLDSLIEIDISNEKLTFINVDAYKKPVGRRKHSANFIGNSLVIFGGFNGVYLNDLYSIEIKSIHQDQTQDDLGLNEFVSSLKIKYGYEVAMKIEAENSLVDCWKDNSDLNILVDLFRQTSQSEISSETENCSSIQIGESTESKPDQVTQGLKKWTKVAGIVILHQQQFQNYIRDNIMIYKSNTFNPELGEYEVQRPINKLEVVNNASLLKSSVSIQVQGHCKLQVSNQIKANNIYFQNCLTEDDKIVITNISDAKDITILQACLVCIKQGVLLVSQRFTIADLIKMLQLTDYFCAQSLLHRIQKLLIQKADLKHIYELISVSVGYKLTHLTNRCSELIINRQYEDFVLENLKIQEKYITDKFNQFQTQLIMGISDETIYPAKFASSLITYFKDNHFSMIINFMNKVREHKEQE